MCRYGYVTPLLKTLPCPQGQTQPLLPYKIGCDPATPYLSPSIPIPPDFNILFYLTAIHTPGTALFYVLFYWCLLHLHRLCFPEWFLKTPSCFTRSHSLRIMKLGIWNGRMWGQLLCTCVHLWAWAGTGEFARGPGGVPHGLRLIFFCPTPGRV